MRFRDRLRRGLFRDRVDGADIDQLGRMIFPAEVNDILRALHIDGVKHLAGIGCNRDNARTVQHAEVFSACGKEIAHRVLLSQVSVIRFHLAWQRIDKRVIFHDQRQNTAFVPHQKLYHSPSEEAGGAGDQIVLIHHTSSFR